MDDHSCILHTGGWIISQPSAWSDGWYLIVASVHHLRRKLQQMEITSLGVLTHAALGDREAKTFALVNARCRDAFKSVVNAVIAFISLSSSEVL